MQKNRSDKLFSVVITISVINGWSAYSQATQPGDGAGIAFEVASIKPNTSASPASAIGFGPGGRFRAVNEPVARLIQEAYATRETPRPKLEGTPSWADAARFDVEAVAAHKPSQAERQAMLRALLQDRFRLSAHRETRSLSVYDLVRSSRDSKRGANLRASDGSCEALRKPGAPTPTAEQFRPCMLAFGNGSLRVNGVTASQFATAGLTRVVDRPVIDRTGLGATLYDWALEWTPDPSQLSAAGATADPAVPSSVFSAVQEQLGLKLETATGSVNVVVIDHLEKPSPD